MTIDLSILPGYAEWKKASPDRTEFMIYSNIRAIGLVAALEIINPPTKVVNSMYVRICPLSDQDDSDDYEWYSGSGLTLSEIESRVNRLRIKDLFYHDPSSDEISSQLLSYFATAIKKYWDFNLAKNFPDANFIVLILDPDVDPEVTFFVQRDDGGLSHCRLGSFI